MTLWASIREKKNQNNNNNNKTKQKNNDAILKLIMYVSFE